MNADQWNCFLCHHKRRNASPLIQRETFTAQRKQLEKDASDCKKRALARFAAGPDTASASSGGQFESSNKDMTMS